MITIPPPPNKRIASLAAAAFAFFAIAATPNTKALFHLPITEAEKALDVILYEASNDDNQAANLFDGTGDKNYRRTFDYTTVLTDALIASMKATEAEFVQKECGGKYIPGDLCGLGFAPVLCAQDVDYPYVYLTRTSTKDTAIISYRWRKDIQIAATYKLIKQQKRWKIDSVICEDLGIKFHADDSGSDAGR